MEREELQTVFADAGELVSVKVIKDRKTGKCRGFGFVTVETDEHADQIIEKYNGTMFQEMPIKIEKALPKAKGQEDEDGETSEPSEPREPSSVPKPNLSNKNSNAAALVALLLPLSAIPAVVLAAVAKKLTGRKVIKAVAAVARHTLVLLPIVSTRSSRGRQTSRTQG